MSPRDSQSPAMSPNSNTVYSVATPLRKGRLSIGSRASEGDDDDDEVKELTAAIETLKSEAIVKMQEKKKRLKEYSKGLKEKLTCSEAEAQDRARELWSVRAQ